MNKTRPARLFIRIMMAATFFIEATGCIRAIAIDKENQVNDGASGATVEAAVIIDSADVDALKSEGGIKDANIRDAANTDVSYKKDGTAGDGGKTDLQRLDTSIIDGGFIPATWVTIQAGTFLMGSPPQEACRTTAETQHQVTLTHPFEIQTTEVTQGQFLNVFGYNTSQFKSCGNNCPVEYVTWYEAAAYCNALSTQKGLTTCYDCSGSGNLVSCAENANYTSGNIYHCPGYRLPTEAEFEYAYRAGTTTSLHNNTNVVNCMSNDDNANAVSWNMYNSSATTHPVGQKPANNWGLYDMSGNVTEWCNDTNNGLLTFDAAPVTDPVGKPGTNYFYRGGSWTYSPYMLRAADRRAGQAGSRGPVLGFRCVKTK